MAVCLHPRGLSIMQHSSLVVNTSFTPSVIPANNIQARIQKPVPPSGKLTLPHVLELVPIRETEVFEGVFRRLLISVTHHAYESSEKEEQISPEVRDESAEGVRQNIRGKIWRYHRCVCQWRESSQPTHQCDLG